MRILDQGGEKVKVTVSRPRPATSGARGRQGARGDRVRAPRAGLRAGGGRRRARDVGAIAVDRRSRTSIDRVYPIDDVTGKGVLATLQRPLGVVAAGDESPIADRGDQLRHDPPRGRPSAPCRSRRSAIPSERASAARHYEGRPVPFSASRKGRRGVAEGVGFDDRRRLHFTPGILGAHRPGRVTRPLPALTLARRGRRRCAQRVRPPDARRGHEGSGRGHRGRPRDPNL